MRDACEQAWSCYSAVMADWLRSSASPRCASLVLSMMFGSTRVRLTKLVLCLTTPPHQSALLTLYQWCSMQNPFILVIHNIWPYPYYPPPQLRYDCQFLWRPISSCCSHWSLGAHVGNAGSILACALPPIVSCFLYCFIVNNIFKRSFSN